MRNCKTCNIPIGKYSKTGCCNPCAQLLPEVRAKRKISLSGSNNPMFGRSGELNPMFGRKHSEETKQLIKEKRKLYVVSDETKQKMSEARKGKPKTEEHKRKIGLAHKV